MYSIWSSGLCLVRLEKHHTNASPSHCFGRDTGALDYCSSFFVSLLTTLIKLVWSRWKHRLCQNMQCNLNLGEKMWKLQKINKSREFRGIQRFPATWSQIKLCFLSNAQFCSASIADSSHEVVGKEGQIKLNSSKRNPDNILLSIDSKKLSLLTLLSIEQFKKC